MSNTVTMPYSDWATVEECLEYESKSNRAELHALMENRTSDPERVKRIRWLQIRNERIRCIIRRIQAGEMEET